MDRMITSLALGLQGVGIPILFESRFEAAHAFIKVKSLLGKRKAVKAESDNKPVAEKNFLRFILKTQDALKKTANWNNPETLGIIHSSITAEKPRF